MVLISVSFNELTIPNGNTAVWLKNEFVVDKIGNFDASD